jgi:hypothetical protein
MTIVIPFQELFGVITVLESFNTMFANSGEASCRINFEMFDLMEIYCLFKKE